MQFKSDSALIFSGGLDSTTLAYLLVSEGLEPHLLSFNYGQRHKKELEFAANTAFKLGLRHDVIDLSGITHLISNSALTSHPSVSAHRDDDIEVPEGHYAEDNMRLTVVPNRNMIMLSIASAVAVNNNYRGVWTGVHAGDHFVYPDCRPTFLRYANGAVVYGNEGFGPIPEQDPNAYPTDFIIAPFTNRTKEEIAKRAFELEVPLEDTWSCYKGGDIHCGRCGTCVERLEAIHAASVQLHGEKAANMGAFDNTRYADTNYWREAVANA
jgi:7-cyano-7-deazaguanine synthase